MATPSATALHNLLEEPDAPAVYESGVDDGNSEHTWSDDSEEEYETCEAEVLDEAPIKQFVGTWSEDADEPAPPAADQRPFVPPVVRDEDTDPTLEPPAPWDPAVDLTEQPWWTGRAVFGAGKPGHKYNTSTATHKLQFRVDISSIVVRRALTEAGFDRVDSGDEWTAYWGRSPKLESFRTFKPFQKVNHFPKTGEVGRKDKLAKNFSRARRLYGSREFDYMPKTYVLPEDRAEFETDYDSNPGASWIVKPRASARGNGIRLFSRKASVLAKRALVQRYIADPFTVNGYKFDMRLYVVVTSIEPLRLYIHPEGLARFATEKYRPGPRNVSNRFMHLTNYSVNKKNDKFSPNQVAEQDDVGSKWSLSALWRHLAALGIDHRPIWYNTKDAIIKAFISAEPNMTSALYMTSPRRCTTFEIYGVDVLLDSKLKPWILEINVSPSLGSPTPMDRKIKLGVVEDMFNLVGFELHGKQRYKAELEALRGARAAPGHRRSRSTPSAVGSASHQSRNGTNSTTRPSEFGKDGDVPSMATFVRRLTPHERELVQETAFEWKRRGRFEVLFPTPNTSKYLKFFPVPRPNNQLLANYVRVEVAHRRTLLERHALLAGMGAVPTSPPPAGLALPLVAGSIGPLPKKKRLPTKTAGSSGSAGSRRSRGSSSAYESSLSQRRTRPRSSSIGSFNSESGLDSRRQRARERDAPPGGPRAAVRTRDPSPSMFRTANVIPYWHPRSHAHGTESSRSWSSSSSKGCARASSSSPSPGSSPNLSARRSLRSRPRSASDTMLQFASAHAASVASAHRQSPFRASSTLHAPPHSSTTPIGHASIAVPMPRRAHSSIGSRAPLLATGLRTSPAGAQATAAVAGDSHAATAKRATPQRSVSLTALDLFPEMQSGAFSEAPAPSSRHLRSTETMLTAAAAGLAALSLRRPAAAVSSDKRPRSSSAVRR